MKVYSGRRTADGCEVTVDGKPLDPQLSLRTLSTTGFEWGYEGGGPSQLALAVLADHFGDGAKALSQYKEFRLSVIGMIRDDEWTLTSNDIERVLGAVTQVPLTLEQLLDKVRGRTPQ